MRSVSRLCFLVWVQLAAVVVLPQRAHAGDMQEQWRLLQDAQAAYQRGLGALQRADKPAAESAFEAAASGFQAVLQLNPLRTDLYAPLGDILVRRGQPAAAYALLVKQTQA